MRNFIELLKLAEQQIAQLNHVNDNYITFHQSTLYLAREFFVI